MSRDALHAPWRMDYIRTLEMPHDASPSGGCFLCHAATLTNAQDESSRRDSLVLWVGEHCQTVANRYPYVNGHLLIAPRRHVASPDELTDAEAVEFHRMTVRACALLRESLSPQGFNLGMNLGRCAGAGLPGHLHQHVVPRWSGDVNFMTVVGDVRVVPQAVSTLYEQLLDVDKRLGTLG